MNLSSHLDSLQSIDLVRLAKCLNAFGSSSIDHSTILQHSSPVLDQLYVEYLSNIKSTITNFSALPDLVDKDCSSTLNTLSTTLQQIHSNPLISKAKPLFDQYKANEQSLAEVQSLFNKLSIPHSASEILHSSLSPSTFNSYLDSLTILATLISNAEHLSSTYSLAGIVMTQLTNLMSSSLSKLSSYVHSCLTTTASSFSVSLESFLPALQLLVKRPSMLTDALEPIIFDRVADVNKTLGLRSSKSLSKMLAVLHEIIEIEFDYFKNLFSGCENFDIVLENILNEICTKSQLFDQLKIVLLTYRNFNTLPTTPKTFENFNSSSLDVDILLMSCYIIFQLKWEMHVLLFFEIWH
ncbi:hypothetical protein GEMRC1_000612 [Eukaryota sp. GEM-RC1]